jgi:hypothetical protein
MSGDSIQKIFEEEREEGDEGWIDRFDNSRVYDEEREEYNRDKPIDSKDKWEKIGLKLEDEWEGVDLLQEGPSPLGDSLCAIEAYTLANQDMEALKDEKKRVNQRLAISTTCGTWKIKKATYKTLKIKIWMAMKTSKKRQMQM